MALFDENTVVVPERRERMSRGRRVGLWALAIAVVALFVLTMLPTGYVIQQPGPVYNTLGSVTNADGDEVPLISVAGADTYQTAGALDLLTVQVVGSRERTPSWLELAAAWFDPSKAVLPVDAVFPADQTTEERSQESTAMMVDSQKEATAAALTELGYDVAPHLTVVSLSEDSPSAGVLQEGDVIESADGQDVTDVTTLRGIINDAAGAPVTLGIQRDGVDQQVVVTPTEVTGSDTSTWVIGTILTTDFTFPIDVTIQLDNVGGPSAGMMFALGIIDTLTPGELNGGRQVAGTGTITADGTVGAIGGIQQKMWGAVSAGADYFLAPASNCDEVVGHIPDGLQVFAVSTLDDSLAVLEAIRTGGDLTTLPTCTSG